MKKVWSGAAGAGAVVVAAAAAAAAAVVVAAAASAAVIDVCLPLYLTSYVHESGRGKETVLEREAF